MKVCQTLKQCFRLSSIFRVRFFLSVSVFSLSFINSCLVQFLSGSQRLGDLHLRCVCFMNRMSGRNFSSSVYLGCGCCLCFCLHFISWCINCFIEIRSKTILTFQIALFCRSLSSCHFLNYNGRVGMILEMGPLLTRTSRNSTNHLNADADVVSFH